MAGEEEEDDYMSDNFLAQTESVRPGLSWGKHARKNDQEKKHRAASTKNKLKPLKQREHEEREKGMNNALTPENKGFALLQKMGYKQGMGLGKKGTGRAEPIPIEVKADRGGLGRGAQLKRRHEIRERLEVEAMRKRQRMMGQLKGDYNQRMRDRFDDKTTNKDLYDSQRSCHHLDDQEGYEEPILSWYWPPKPEEKKLEDDDVTDQTEGAVQIEEEEEEEEGDDEEEDGLSPQEKLQELTKYLRDTYHYCVWCGTSYEDYKDLLANCPGNTNDDHN